MEELTNNPEMDAASRLEALSRDIADCRACPLCEGRTHVVVGAGDPHARVMIIGEAPGKNEDKAGMPFVGAAGQALSEYLKLAQLTREEIYIANVLKCRPPSNRNPKPEEILACSDYLREQTRIIHPEIIVTLGNFATQFILKTGVGITALRGKVTRTGPFQVLPMFHPAAAIYDRSKREYLVQDFTYLGQLLKELS